MGRAAVKVKQVPGRSQIFEHYITRFIFLDTEREKYLYIYNLRYDRKETCLFRVSAVNHARKILLRKIFR